MAPPGGASSDIYPAAVDLVGKLRCGCIAQLFSVPALT